MSKIVFFPETDRLMAVYPIVNGCSREAIFEGTHAECKVYVKTLLENKPEMRGNLIVLDV